LIKRPPAIEDDRVSDLLLSLESWVARHVVFYTNCKMSGTTPATHLTYQVSSNAEITTKSDIWPLNKKYSYIKLLHKWTHLYIHFLIVNLLHGWI